MSNANDPTAQYFDILSAPIKSKELTEEELTFVTTQFPPNSNILDIGSGHGRHLLPLAELGYKVTGIEQSNVMFNMLRRNVDKLNPEIKQNVTLEKQNIFEFKTTKQFDLITMFWNTFNEIALNTDEGTKLINHLKSLLKLGGAILVNSNDPDKENMKKMEYELEVDTEDRIYFIKWNVIKYSKKNHVTTSEEKVTEIDKFDRRSPKSIFQTYIKQKWWTVDEYKNLAKDHNLNFKQINAKTSNELYIIFSN